MFNENQNILRNSGDIYYALYNKLYVVRSQANCMAHVFDVVLNRNPDQVQDALARLKCLSETDYSAPDFMQAKQTTQLQYGDIPAGFRTCKIFEAAGKKVCLGTSYSEKAKLKYIAELIALCREPQEVFNYRTAPSENALRIDSRYRKRRTRCSATICLIKSIEQIKVNLWKGCLKSVSGGILIPSNGP